MMLLTQDIVVHLFLGTWNGKSKRYKRKKNSVIAVIGDGALTGGMAFEALNDTGSSNTNLIVILNDNEMSISKKCWRTFTFLTRIRTRKSYNKSNNYIKKNYVENTIYR